MIQNKCCSDNDNTNKKFEIKYHFTWIKTFSRLVSKQLTGNKSALFICDRCLNYFRSMPKLDKHVVEC